MKVEKEFINYLKSERRAVNRALIVTWCDHNAKERVSIENLLIAYDQAVDRLEQISKEQL